MSTLKTTYIQHPSAASPNLELKADGTLALPLSGIGDLSDVDEGSGASDGDVLTYDGVGNVWVPESIVFPAGIGSNVVQTFKNDTFSSTSTSFVDVTGLSVSITPSSATSKILIAGSLNFSSAPSTYVLWNLLRNSTLIAQPAGGANPATGVHWFANNAVGATHGQATHSLFFLDSPATTSSVTYKIQARTNSGTFRLNEDPTTYTATSTLLAIEVAA